MSATATLDLRTGQVAGLDELDADATLDAARDAVRARRAAEVADMRVVAHWAALHGEPQESEHDLPDHARGSLVQPGGEGTPEVQDWCLPELAMVRGTHYATTKALMADVLDLMHRLPRTWKVVESLECEPWVARKVAVISRCVSRSRVGIVDRAVADAIAGHAPSTVLEVAQAKVIEADPDDHEQRRNYERRGRYVALSKSDEQGYRTIIAKMEAGDAAWVDAMVDRVADILTLSHGDDHNRDELRSMAMGWLARPADLLRLLLEHTVEPEGLDGEPPVWAPEHLTQTLARLAALTPRQLAALRPRGVVHVHVHEAAIQGRATVARVEGMGPMLVGELIRLLGHADVSLLPVLDLNGRIRVDRYEHPESLKDHVWEVVGGDYFPWSPRTATRDQVDFDHPRPYQVNGPPGQTGTHNSGPLRRTRHRWKTFGGYSSVQSGPGRYVVTSPHGRSWLRNETGTHPLDSERAEAIKDAASSGVDLYVSDVVLDLSSYQPSWS